MKYRIPIVKLFLPVALLGASLAPYVVRSDIVASAAAAEKPVSEYAVKVAYLYNFTKFVEWPSGFNQSDINICIAGKDPFGAELNNLEKASTPSLRVHVIRNAPDAQFRTCNILFISKSEEHRVSKILSEVADAPVLTVSEIKNFADLGGHIGFVTVEENVGLFSKEKLRLIINLKTAAASQLKINANLLEIAQDVIRK